MMNKSVPQLIKILERHFNKFIRNRDATLPCISCGRYAQLQAGHYFSAGHYSALRFDEINVNGQCKHCNLFLSGNLINYRKGLINKYGLCVVEKLELKAKMQRQHKWDRFALMQDIEKYKKLCKV